jgi:uncharacterized membrane protein (UPF0127 family)
MNQERHRAFVVDAVSPAQIPDSLIVQPVNRPIPIPAQIRKYARFQDRFLGLMFRSRLDHDLGALLVGRRDSKLDAAIHMLFVNFDLAVFWISSQLVVVDKVLARSWHPVYIPAKAARYVLELHPDRFADYEIGESIQFVES